MTSRRLRSSIAAYLEQAGVWVIEPRRADLPDLLLPEYGWLFVALPDMPLTAEQNAAHRKATLAGVRSVVVRSVHEALLQVSSWQIEKNNAAVVRPRYLTRIK